MKIYRFTQDTGSSIDKYNSHAASYSRICEISQPGSVGCIYIEPEGIVGLHAAPVPQLFLVVQGTGWVRGEDGARIPVREGDGVFWDRGESHESGSAGGMVAMTLQSDKLGPGICMRVKDI